MDQSEFFGLLERSDAFQQKLVNVAQDTYAQNDQLAAIWPLVLIVQEHAACIRALVAGNMGNSALALMRVLFDAVIRQMWAGFCASPKQLEILNRDFTPEALENSLNLPMTKLMLRDLERDGPPALYKQLSQFIEYSWKPLNSIVHTSLHAVHIANVGLSIELASQLIKQSNNLLHMSCYQIAFISGCLDTHEAMISIYSDYDDCLQR